MKFQLAVLILGMGIISSPCQQADSSQSLLGSTMQNAYSDFLVGKKSHTSLWYTGTIFAGTGALSWVVASHFDGMAAQERNKAALNLQNHTDQALYVQERGVMQDRQNIRDILFYVGLGFGVTGGSMMAYDFFVNRKSRLSLQVNPQSLALNLNW